ncbi:MAG: type II toxin-antitoxin system VapC family toxin [Lautropia sp.]|nr:type II toxin-antitoxin system VapC family toxin [Lautropia sp.]
MLDTNMLIYMLKQRPPSVVLKVVQLLSKDPQSLCMSFVTWAELLKGAEHSIRPEQTRKSLDCLAESVPILYVVSDAMCRYHAQFSVMLQARGTPIGSNDLWIAAHAMASGCTLVTNNQREFSRIPELVLDNWV